MNILEEFWYGNIEPAEYDTSSSKEYKELLQLISRNEDKLLATMTEGQKELFTKYADCIREYQVMAECLLFQNSFRLGGRMMLEVMKGDIRNGQVSADLFWYIADSQNQSSFGPEGFLSGHINESCPETVHRIVPGLRRYIACSGSSYVPPLTSAK